MLKDTEGLMKSENDYYLQLHSRVCVSETSRNINDLVRQQFMMRRYKIVSGSDSRNKPNCTVMWLRKCLGQRH